MENALVLRKLNIVTKGKNTMGNSGNKKITKHIKGALKNLIAPVVVGIISAFLSSFVTTKVSLARFEEKFISIDKSLNSIESNISDTKSNIQNNAGDIKELLSRVGTIEGHLGINIVSIEPSDSFKDIVVATYQSEESIISKSSDSLWEDSDIIIGTDKAKGKPYTAADLENETVILSYTDTDGSIVFFRGQFNENGRWDKDCTINRYTNGKLSMIMDTVYDDGKLVTYKQVMPTIINTNNEDRDVWLVSEREVTNEGNIGKTWTYYKQEDIQQECYTENFESSDIMSQDDFLAKNDLILESYYCGNTSNDKYNDDTGNAYIVKYNQDGYVRFLYEGRFVDGMPYDTTGDAWSISFGFDGKHYYYYQGSIKNSVRSRDLTTDDIVTVEQINEILKDKTFNCELQWYSFED